MDGRNVINDDPFAYGILLERKHQHKQQQCHSIAFENLINYLLKYGLFRCSHNGSAMTVAATHAEVDPTYKASSLAVIRRFPFLIKTQIPLRHIAR